MSAPAAGLCGVPASRAFDTPVLELWDDAEAQIGIGKKNMYGEVP